MSRDPGRRKRGPRREELAAGECLCDHCTGRCCRYFSLPIDNPRPGTTTTRFAGTWRTDGR